MRKVRNTEASHVKFRDEAVVHQELIQLKVLRQEVEV